MLFFAHFPFASIPMAGLISDTIFHEAIEVMEKRALGTKVERLNFLEGVHQHILDDISRLYLLPQFAAQAVAHGSQYAILVTPVELVDSLGITLLDMQQQRGSGMGIRHNADPNVYLTETVPIRNQSIEE